MSQDQVYKNDFNVKKYVGKWYLVGIISDSDDFTPIEIDYTMKKGGVIEYDNCRVVNNEKSHSKGRGKALDCSQPSAITMVEQNQPLAGIANYIIHETDYHNYAVVGSNDKKYLFILSRKPTINKSMFRN